MALTYVNFLTIYRWSQGPTANQVLNVVDAKETIRSGGSLRPAFDGTMLSTLRTPKRSWDVTVEFPSGFELDVFVNFTSSLVNGQRSGLADMGITARGPGVPHSLLRTALSPLRVYIQPLSLQVTGEQVLNSTVTPMWQAQLSILEI